MICEVNGVQLYYEKCGEGRPIILVHGNGESHEIFDVLIDELRATHTVYAVDSRGHGESSRGVAVSYALMAEDYRLFIQKLKIEKPIWYGFSDGGIIGLLLALQAPELLGKLIISGANLNPQGLKWHTRLLMWPAARRGDALYQMMLREPQIPARALRRITVPTVVLAGAHDCIRPAHTALIAENIPGSVLEIIPHESHGSYIVHSEKLYPILKKYL